MEYRNRNRGYQQLRVWQQAIQYYVSTCRVLRVSATLPQRLFVDQVATCDSIHRNVAEGYARRSVREYINFLYYALGSLAESVSALHAYLAAEQLDAATHAMLDKDAFHLENALLKLIEALERKRDDGTWTDNLLLHDLELLYEGSSESG